MTNISGRQGDTRRTHPVPLSTGYWFALEDISPNYGFCGVMISDDDHAKQPYNKKVLLRERKRHTARRVMSTPSVVLPGYPPRGGRGGTWPGTPPGGVPDPGTPPGGYLTCIPPGGYLTWVPPRGVPDLGTPPGGYLTWVPPLTRVPPQGGTWLGYPPGGVPDLGTPPGGVPDLGTPPPPLPHGILGNVAKHYGIWVPPPPCGQTDWWMDRRVSKHYLPSYYVRGR